MSEMSGTAGREGALREELRRAQEEVERQGSITHGARQSQQRAERSQAEQARTEQQGGAVESPRPRRQRVALIAGVGVVLVAAVVAIVLVSSSGSKKPAPSGASAPATAAEESSPASQGSNANPVGIDAMGSPERFVRDWMIAAYSGNTGETCAQLTAAAISAASSYNSEWSCSTEVPEVVAKETRNNPNPVAILRKAAFYPREAGNRAVVQISGPGVPVGDSSMVHLVRTGGRWWINCAGYCGGTSP